MPMTGYIYFVTFDLETVKVGFATDVRSRLSQIQVSSPAELTEIVRYLGTPDDEGRIHNLLRQHRIRGEWFDWNDEVDGFMEDMFDALISLQIEHGAGYEPTARECLDFLGLDTTAPAMPEVALHVVRRVKKKEMQARLARLAAEAAPVSSPCMERN